MILSMGSFRRDNNGGSRFGGGRGRRDFGRRNDGPREMFKTVCSSCGKECEVPFKPTTGKPVYCSDCFDKVGGRSDDRRSDRPSFNRPQVPSVDYTKQFEELNAKLNKIIELLTPKTEEGIKPEKPIKTPKVKKATKK